MDISHEPERRRFVARIDGEEAVLEYAERGDGILDYRHTYTPPALRGQGVARQIVLFALEYAREQQLHVIPTCPFVAKIVREHPVYAPLIADAR